MFSSVEIITISFFNASSESRYKSFIKSQLRRLEDFYNDFEDGSKRIDNSDDQQTERPEELEGTEELRESEDSEEFTNHIDKLEA